MYIALQFVLLLGSTYVCVCLANVHNPKAQSINRQYKYTYSGVGHFFFYVPSETESSLFEHPMLVRAPAATSSQVLPMVDGGWIVLEGPNIICIGHKLGFRASGRTVSSLTMTGGVYA